MIIIRWWSRTPVTIPVMTPSRIPRDMSPTAPNGGIPTKRERLPCFQMKSRGRRNSAPKHTPTATVMKDTLVSMSRSIRLSMINYMLMSIPTVTAPPVFPTTALTSPIPSRLMSIMTVMAIFATTASKISILIRPTATVIILATPATIAR